MIYYFYKYDYIDTTSSGLLVDTKTEVKYFDTYELWDGTDDGKPIYRNKLRNNHIIYEIECGTRTYRL